MRKSLFILVAVIALVFASVSCKKEEVKIDSLKPQYVDAIAGSFIAKEGDIMTKSADLTKVTRTWTMQARNSTFYSNAAFANVTGLEFIAGSAAYNFWSVSANNPVTFPVSQAVYSNLTPDEDLRLITETKNSANEVAYLGILDFNPDYASFPITLHSLRLGDKLTLNTDALTSLPGGNNLIFKVTINVAPVNLAATKIVAITGLSSTPNGNELSWSNIQYGTAVTSDVILSGTGDQEVYDELSGKVTGITITITETGNGGSTITKTVTAAGAGQGLKLTLTTARTGWYDSGTIGFTDEDITIISQNVVVE